MTPRRRPLLSIRIDRPIRCRSTGLDTCFISTMALVPRAPWTTSSPMPTAAACADLRMMWPTGPIRSTCSLRSTPSKAREICAARCSRCATPRARGAATCATCVTSCARASTACRGCRRPMLVRGTTRRRSPSHSVTRAWGLRWSFCTASCHIWMSSPVPRSSETLGKKRSRSRARRRPAWILSMVIMM